MASPHLSEFVYKSCADAIRKYREGGEDSGKLMELSGWLSNFRADGTITDAQLAALSEMLGVEVEVPDAPDTYEATIASVQQDVADLMDGIAELGEVVSGIVEPTE